MPENPMIVSKWIADLLDGDPLMARQVKEHISEERLCQLLEITPQVITEEADE